jgi:hypothetical protein
MKLIRVAWTRALAATVLALGARTATAQGTLSTQGFGYPPGQLSARAQATGGALGEFDPLSPLNPAAILAFGVSSVYFQSSPEIRWVTVGGHTDRSVLPRFPVVSASISLTDRLILGASISTIADRTWRTDSALLIGRAPDTASAIATFRAAGALNDVQLAIAYAPHPALHLGIAFHTLSGDNRTERDLTVLDTLRYTSSRDLEEFSFAGQGMSVGIDWHPWRPLGIAASARVGGTVTAYRNDTVLTRGRFPARTGGAIQFSGVPGAVIAAGVDWERWSRLKGLSATGVPTYDATSLSLGAEMRGPHLLGVELPLRAGVRRRTLPFGLPNGARVRETVIAGGIALPLAGGRAGVDLSLERDVRSAASTARERALTLSIGVAVHL